MLVEKKEKGRCACVINKKWQNPSVKFGSQGTKASYLYRLVSSAPVSNGRFPKERETEWRIMVQVCWVEIEIKTANRPTFILTLSLILLYIHANIFEAINFRIWITIFFLVLCYIPQHREDQSPQLMNSAFQPHSFLANNFRNGFKLDQGTREIWYIWTEDIGIDMALL